MTMRSGTVLEEAIKLLKPDLKQRGFSPKGKLSFVKKAKSGGNTELLQFQRSQESTAEMTLVTINYGIHSARIAAALHEDGSASTDVTCAHWRKRIRKEGKEHWITVWHSDDPHSIYRILEQASSEVIDELDRHSSDEALRDVWLSGAGPGIVKMSRLLHLAILLRDLGPEEQLPGVISALRKLVSGSVHEGRIERQLGQIGLLPA